ncbi:MAG TPA: spondin domain-containing protein [Chloroflexia bacterium]|nr:spondin domain-containing protein [Chloroflexia bacterium]
MSNLKRTLVGMLVLTLLGIQVAPYRAAAQAGTKTYEVTVTNITTSKQGLSPVIIATHPASVHAWQMGQMASKGLELVAEEGKNDTLASEWRSVATDVQATKAHLLPGDSITIMITAKDGDVLSAATMLIQTNDGFTGLDNMALTEGSKDTMAYDAGTEDNSEAAADVPGPPFGGMNHGPDSNPHQPIGMHEGITGKADVTPDFNWTGPVARFSVRAIDPPSVAPGMTAYDVTVTNITTSKQGLSPVVIASHPSSVDAWQMGQLASKGLELVAEEGKNDMLASEWQSVATEVKATKAHLLPGDSITIRINAKNGDVLSAATMLIQTNDGFTGLDSMAIADGDHDTMAYDAGTEDNSELAADIPGPPFGGMNHGPDSNPHQPIAPHGGIAGKADVTPDFNWVGPVARFSVKTVGSGGGALPTTPTTPEVPDMPKTGAGDTIAWFVLVGAACVLLFTGIVMRRVPATRR